jgi:acetyl-CoA carboxylase carboxyltransferase component
VPLVLLLEGAGHRLEDAAAGRRPNDLQGIADLSGKVPTVCAVLGPSAGHGALSALLCDFVIMTEGASMFSAGPPLVKAAVGEEVEKEELGGPEVHLRRSGVAHNGARDDTSAIDLVRRYLSYFPSNAWTRSPRAAGPDVEPRRIEEILDLVDPDPRKPYPMRELVQLAFDQGSVLEVQPSYGASILTCLARLGGHSVAVVANDPSVMAGTIDSAAASKAARALEVAGAYHLPVVFLADNPGVMAGRHAESEGVLRQASRMFAAQHRLEVPKLHVTLRKAFGFGSSVMAMNPFDGQTVSIAFPAITLGAMPAESGSEAAKLSEGSRARVAAAQSASTFRAAHTMSFDDVIDPRDLRIALIKALELAMARLHGPAGPVSHTGILP